MVELSVGILFANRFTVEKRIKSGGMGLVYRARDRQSNRPVALKLLTGQQAADQIDRFMREARMLSELRHPGIVAYIAHGISSEGQPYLAMEWLEGEDLSALLQRQRMSVQEALTLLRCAAAALQVAHQAGMLHRDLKPSNLFLREGRVDRVTLIDFGLARRALGNQLTQTGLVMGTPEYMAPEQARADRQIGPSADIFSLGCIAFECLTGQPPFVSEHVAGVLAKILFEEAPSLRIVRPDLPEPLSKLIARMLTKSPLARIPDATALLAELETIGDLSNLEPPTLKGSISNLRFEMAGSEQVLVSVVIAQDRDGKRDALLTMDPNPTPAKGAESQSATLKEALLQFGANVECMIDGSLIATLTRQGVAVDQAIHAARCALIIKDRWPDSIVALATGRAVVEGSAIFGEVLGRIGLMLETSRQQGETRPGEVIVDEITSRLIENHFVVNREGDLRLLFGGMGQPADETRPLLGVPTQCVGRERELNLLDASFGACRENGAATVVLVSAPPGVGKSRLRHEFLRRVQAQSPDALILMGHGDPISVGASYGLLSQALRTLFGIVGREDLRIAHEKIQARVSQCIDSGDVQRVSEFLGEICDTPFPDSILLRAARQDPRVMSDHVAQTFIKFLNAECSRHPVLIVLEDLHWGDMLTVKILDAALRELVDQPLMVLAFARPEVEDLFPKLWAERGRQDIRLSGLPKRACERLVQQVLGKKISPSVQARIIEQAAGNALFLEELVRAAAEGKGDEMPETVLAILHARFMRLMPEARRILRTASLFGEKFWVGGVRKLLGRERMADQLENWLQIFVESELIEQRKDSSFPGEVEYAFRHGLLREAAYGMLPDDERRVGHYLVGCYLEEVGESDPMALAEHFQRSDDQARAVILFTRAAEQAFDRNDLEGSLRRIDRGLACGAEGETLGALYALQTAAWFWRNDLDQAISTGLEALGLLTPGTLHWFRAITFAASSAAALGRRSIVSELSLRFGTVAPTAEILGSYVEATAYLAIMLGLIGDRSMCELFLSHVEVAGAPVADSDPHVRGWMNYSWGRYLTSLRLAPLETVERFQHALNAFHSIGDRRMSVCSAGDLGFTLARLGRPQESEALLRDNVVLALRLDEPITTTWVQMYLALVLCERQEEAAWKEAQRLAEGILNTIGDSSYYSGFANCALAAVHCANQDWAQAEDRARKALEILRPTQSSAPLGFIALGRVYLLSGRPEEAVRILGECVELMSSLGGGGGSEVPTRMALVAALHAAQRPEEAAQAEAELNRTISLCLQEISDSGARDSYRTRLEKYRTTVPLF